MKTKLFSAMASVMYAAALCANAGAQDTPAPAGSPSPIFCPIEVHVATLRNHPDEALVTLWTSIGTDTQPGPVSGTITIYSGTVRYEFPVADAVAAGLHHTNIPPTPLVISIAANAIDSGYVSTLDHHACAIRRPYVKGALVVNKGPNKVLSNPNFPVSKSSVYPWSDWDWKAAWQNVSDDAALLPARSIGDGKIVDAPACNQPYVTAYTASATSAPLPRSPQLTGYLTVTLDVDEHGQTTALSLDRSSGDKGYDDMALATATTAHFVPQIYRCEPLSGKYRFIVQF